MARIQRVPTDSLHVNPNTRIASVPRSLDALLRSEGMNQPLIVSEDTGEIIDGVQRWHAAKRIGMLEVPVIKVPVHGQAPAPD